MKNIPFSCTLVQGAIGKKFVIKHYPYGPVKTKFPCMDNIIASSQQQHCRSIFKEAVAFARSINNDPLKKQQWSKRYKTTNVYNHAIRQYMRSYGQLKK